MVYECSCGFSASTATSMHKHLTAAAQEDPGRRDESLHRLVSGYKPSGRVAANKQQQPAGGADAGPAASGATLARLRLQAAAGGSDRPASGSSTPNSMGFVSISPSAAHAAGPDPTAAAWEAVEAFYPSTSSGGEPCNTTSGSPHAAPGPLTAHMAGSASLQAGAAGHASYSRSDAPASARPSPSAAAAAAAAASRLNVALTAAITARPGSRAKGGNGSTASRGSPAAAEDAAAAAAVPLPVSSRPAASGGSAPRQQQQQQQQQEFRFGEQQADNVDLAASLGSAFGVRVTGSVMAAFGGWVVNEAVNAAAAAMAAPASEQAAAQQDCASPGSKARPVDPATPTAAAPGDAGAGSGARWSLSGLLQGTRKTTPRAGGSDRLGEASGVAAKSAAAAAPGGGAGGVAAERSGSRGLAFWRRSSSDDADDSLSDCLLSDEDASAWLGDAPGVGCGAVNTTAAGGAGGAAQLVVQRPGVAGRVKLLRGLLMWRDVGASLKALALGMYCILLVGSIPRGLHYMQLTTTLPGLALLWLLYNAAKPWAIRAYCSLASGGGPSPAAINAWLAGCEAALTQQAVSWSGRAVDELGTWALALLVLAHRALRGAAFTTSMWTGVSLWLLLLLSELRIMNQTLLAVLAFGGLFSVPWCYYRFRAVIDAAVCDGVHLVSLLALHAERWAYCVAVLAAALAWQLLADEGGRGSLVVQGSGAALAGLAVLVWRVVVAES